MEKGGLSEHNYITNAVCYGLRVDLGMFGTRGLIGDLSEEDKNKVATFAGKMSDFLIRKK